MNNNTILSLIVIACFILFLILIIYMNTVKRLRKERDKLQRKYDNLQNSYFELSRICDNLAGSADDVCKSNLELSKIGKDTVEIFRDCIKDMSKFINKPDKQCWLDPTGCKYKYVVYCKDKQVRIHGYNGDLRSLINYLTFQLDIGAIYVVDIYDNNHNLIYRSSQMTK